MKVFYCVIEDDKSNRICYETTSRYDLDVDYECEALLEDCADHYWNENDGWDSSWPLTFTLHLTEDGPEIIRSKITMEAEPRFYASITTQSTKGEI